MAVGWADLNRAEREMAPRAATVCVVIRGETRPNMDEEFEGLLTDLAYQIRAGERDCLSYVITRAIGSRTHFAAHARFASWQAFQRHGVTPHLKRALPRLTALLAAPVALEIFLEI